MSEEKKLKERKIVTLTYCFFLNGQVSGTDFSVSEEKKMQLDVVQGFQPNFGIEFHDFSMILPEIFPFFQGTSNE